MKVISYDVKLWRIVEGQRMGIENIRVQAYSKDQAQKRAIARANAGTRPGITHEIRDDGATVSSKGVKRREIKTYNLRESTG